MKLISGLNISKEKFDLINSWIELNKDIFLDEVTFDYGYKSGDWCVTIFGSCRTMTQSSEVVNNLLLAIKKAEFGNFFPLKVEFDGDPRTETTFSIRISSETYNEHAEI